MSIEAFPRFPFRSYPPRWKIYENGFPDYMADFQVVDTDHKIIEQLNRIQKDPDSVIVDLMATTRALRHLKNHGHQAKMLAVGVDDDRAGIEQEMDELTGISFIQGDLNKSRTWRNISTWLGNRTVDLLMERGYGALHFVPTRIDYERAVLSRMWDMVNPDGGLVVLQTPPQEVLEARGIPITSWQAQLSDAGIYNKFGLLRESKDGFLDYGILILKKNPNTPVLPDILDRKDYPRRHVTLFKGSRH